MHKFTIDDLRYYVWAFEQFGFNIRYLVDGYEDVDQVSLEAIDGHLETELGYDATHQQEFWMYIDGAAEAIGMLEADGIKLDTNGRIFRESYFNAYSRRDRDAFVSKIKPNVERVKGSIRNAPLGFEAVPYHEHDKDVIADLNKYVFEILNQNNFEAQKELMIHDFVAYGSGALFNCRIKDRAQSDLIRYEEALRKGAQLSYDDWMAFERLHHSQVIEHISTFELIRPRSVKGHRSTDLKNYPYIHWVKQLRISELRQKYPKYASQIDQQTNTYYTLTNPYSLVVSHNDDSATLKRTYINFPVSYEIDVPVQMGSGVEIKKVRRNRMAVARIDRVEGVGVVDMAIDEHWHNLIPIDYAVNNPSSKHACGIGLAKYGRDAQRIATIMMNGKLRFFNRMVKGGGFYAKGLLNQDTINKRAQENAWVEVDMEALPANLRNVPLSQLIAENKPSSFPTVYNDLLLNAKQDIDEAMSVPDAARGVQQGNSGRQEAILSSQAEIVMSTSIAAFEAMYLNMGNKVYSDIVQFDVEPFAVPVRDPFTGNREIVGFNIPLAEYVIQNPETGEEEVVTERTQNDLKNLQFKVSIATRPLLPVNPTERRLFYQNVMMQILPFVQTGAGKKELIFLKYFDLQGFGGLPGFKEMVDELFAALEEDRQAQLIQMQQQQAQAAEQMQFNKQLKAAELTQDAKRIDGKILTDIMKAINNGGKVNPQELEQFAQNYNQ